MYRGYEDYMQTVLGYSYGPDTYREAEIYNNIQMNSNIQDLNRLYPEIYKIVYPVIQKVCARRTMSNITEEMISEMVEEVYRVIEPGDGIIEEKEPPLKNGDVRNPRAKDIRQQRRNPLLRDLIRILLLRELFDGRPGNFPGGPMPRPPMPNPGHMPKPPIFRPGNIRN